tara:strand:+ start:1319 stop:2707 length:1389 start_codon:yes stop_codon:yes gene_type:complete
MSDLSISLYTDDQVYSLTDYITALRIEHMITNPYSQASVTLKVPNDLIKDVLPLYDNNAFNLDSWLVVRDNTLKTTIFLGCASSTSQGIEVFDDGLKETSNFTIDFDSWIDPLIKGQIYLSGQSLGLNGHVLNINTWGQLINKAISTPFTVSDVGFTLKAVFNLLSKYYRFPKKLVNTTFFSVPVVHNVATSKLYAPKRADRQRAIHGLAVNTSSSIQTGSTAWGMITSSFDVDPNMIELFPSLEPSTVQNGALGTALQATPVLMYRLKPFIFKNVNSASSTAINETSIHPFITAPLISSERIQSLSLSSNEGNRINAVYLNTPLTQSKGVETFGLVGVPKLNRTDIERNGLRLYKGNYPFFPRKSERPLVDEVQYSIQQASQILFNSHLYFNGNATFLYDGSIRAGMWINLQVQSVSNVRVLCCYVEKVEHTINVLGLNVIQSRTRVRFTRAFYADAEPKS